MKKLALFALAFVALCTSCLLYTGQPSALATQGIRYGLYEPVQHNKTQADIIKFHGDSARIARYCATHCLSIAYYGEEVVELTSRPSALDYFKSTRVGAVHCCVVLPNQYLLPE